MVPDGDKQKRVKIYEGSFPVFSVNLTPAHDSASARVRERVYENLQARTKVLNERIQKLEEKLEEKAAECIKLKIGYDELSVLFRRMMDIIQV
jgi:hypothetical protein